MLLYMDDIFLEHDTGQHPERAERLRRIHQHLRASGTADRCRIIQPPSASPEQLARVHRAEYVSEIRRFAEEHGGYIEADTVCSRRSFDVACHAAGAVCDAVERVLRGEDKRAVCLVRPPGHHALPAAAMGFCLFNNVAVGARLATGPLGLDRVLIVDFDVHHGNGTQDAFWEDGQVGFLSMHRFPFYPGTGRRDETGAGKGLGMIRNLPVTFGTPRPDILSRFAAELQDFADKVKPQLVLVSAGFDAHRLDPIGSLGLETEDFDALTESVKAVAQQHADGKIVSMLEGGYNVDVLPTCVETHLKVLLSQVG